MPYVSKNLQKSHKSAPKTLSKRLSKLEKEVKVQRPEVQLIDIDIQKLNITSAGTVVHLNAVAEGSDITQRVGDEMTSLSYNMKGAFNYSGITSGKYYRICVVEDRQQISDTLPTCGDVFSDTRPQSLFQTIVQRHRFKILHMGKLVDGGKVNLGGQSPTFAHYLKYKKIVKFNAGASSDIQKNGVYMLILTDDNANTVDFLGNSRLAFFT